MSAVSNVLAIRALEFDVVLRHVAERCKSAVAGDAILATKPFVDETLLSDALRRVSAMQALLGFDDPFPMESFPDFKPAFARADMEGAYLEAAVFTQLGRFLAMVRLLRKYFADRPEKYQVLHPMAERLVALKSLEEAIAHVVDEQGDVRDRASARLSEIRREMARVEQRMRGRLDALMRQMAAKGYAQEETLAFRQGRSLIPMLDSHRSKLPGVIVDQSQSGGTVYMEPLEVVELRNRLNRLQSEEQDEVLRILRELTARLREELTAVEINFTVAVDFDMLAARARFGLDLEAVPAALAPDGTLHLEQARHPLLLMKMSYTDVVPLSLVLDESKRTLIITGPNAGGKTVALKTVGLLALMHMHGLPVPAGPKTSLPLFRHVFADIGDRQSIEQDLSTFSSHIQEIAAILEVADHRSMILMDEIGSATDPAEGSALAQVILEALTRRGALTLATTHMGALKVFAHEADGVGNGSMAFDQETLRPTYRFQAGIPGSSYAFEIAHRFGIEADLIDRARSLVGEDRGKVESLILHLESEVEKAAAFRKEVELKDVRLAGLTALYDDRLEKLKAEGEARKEAIIEEAQTLLKEANATVENLVREIKEKQAGQDSVKQAKAALNKEQQRAAELKKRSEAEDVQPGPIEKGDWVRWQGHGGKGEVLSAPDKKGRVQVNLNGLKMRLPLNELQPVKAPKPQQKVSMVRTVKSSPDVSTEIDVRGMRGLEAVELVDKYLSDANMSGFSRVSVIHGKGTGVLRKEITAMLESHPLVKSRRHGSWQEGDTGITIVELK